jgi:hypothetical protein
VAKDAGGHHYFSSAKDELRSSARSLRSLLLLARAALCLDVGGVAAPREDQHSGRG